MGALAPRARDATRPALGGVSPAAAKRGGGGAAALGAAAAARASQSTDGPVGDAGGFAIAVLDNRGIGRSARRPTRAAYSVAAFAADTRRALAELGWADAPVHVVGHSMGGMIALELVGRAAAAATRAAGGAAGARDPP